MSIANELSSEIAVALMTRTRDGQTQPDAQQISQLVLQLHSTLNDLKAKTKLAHQQRVTVPRKAAVS